MSKQRRYRPSVRRSLILSAACTLAANGTPYYQLTREQIAQAAGVTASTLRYHFGGIGLLRRCVVDFAIQHDYLAVIAQAMTVRDPAVRGLDGETRRRAAGYISLQFD